MIEKTIKKIRRILIHVAEISFVPSGTAEHVTFEVTREGKPDLLKSSTAHALDTEKVARNRSIFAAIEAKATSVGTLNNAADVREFATYALSDLLTRITAGTRFHEGRICVEIKGLHPLMATAMAARCSAILGSATKAWGIEKVINRHGYLIRIGKEIEVMKGESFFPPSRRSDPFSAPAGRQFVPLRLAA